MAADFHIHILGSEYASPMKMYEKMAGEARFRDFGETDDKIHDCHVESASWGEYAWVPRRVRMLEAVILTVTHDETTEVTGQLIELVTAILQFPDRDGLEESIRRTDPEEVVAFLRKNIGRHVFSMIW